MRSIDEWIGKSDDSPVPAGVRLRIFDRCGGRCHVSGRLIRAGERWDLDHIIALGNGGRHRESNLAPALTAPHREKTTQDVKEMATVRRKRKKHLGIQSRKRKIPGRRFDGTPIR